MKSSAYSHDTTATSTCTHLPPINLNGHNNKPPSNGSGGGRGSGSFRQSQHSHSNNTHHQHHYHKPPSQQSNHSGSTNSTTNHSSTADNKYYPFIDKNHAFKYIRDHLATKHWENTNRPTFNIAGIAPITDDDKALK
jgi:hypothetical protein